MVAVTLERTESRYERAVAAVFAAPVWLLTTVTLLAATLVHGYNHSTAMAETVKLVADPFTQNHQTGAWGYQSPIGPILAWVLGAETPRQIALVSYGITIVSVSLGVWAVAKWASPYAARLWLIAYFCSPQSWAGTASLGEFDIITVAGLTVAFVAPPGACFAAGLLIGLNHFEQGGIALVAIAVIRCYMRRESRQSMVAAFGGLLLGKLAVTSYLLICGIDTNGRLDFIRDKGVADIVSGWTGHLLTLEWAVYNVLWVGVIWMLWTMRRDDRNTTILLHLLLTLPVLITYDLSRVYRTVAWPIVMLLVIYAAEWPDRQMVRRVALLLAIAAVFVPRTEIWHGGRIIN